MTTRLGAALTCFALLAACGGSEDGREESPIDAIDAPTTQGVPASDATVQAPDAGPDALPPIRLATPAINVPESVPRPAGYTLLNEVPGPGVLLTTVEVQEDVRELAARFNEEMARSGARHQPLREEQDADGRFVATGHLETEQGRVRIGIREYRAGETPPSGGTGEVTYGVPTGRS